MTTTTNVFGVEYPDEVLAEAVEVADALDVMLPDLWALLDRAKWVTSAIEIAGHEHHHFDRPDEHWQALEDQTAYKRILDHVERIRERTEDRRMVTVEHRALLDAYHSRSGD
jgi:hypothetical protein